MWHTPNSVVTKSSRNLRTFFFPSVPSSLVPAPRSRSSLVAVVVVAVAVGAADGGGRQHSGRGRPRPYQRRRRRRPFLSSCSARQPLTVSPRTCASSGNLRSRRLVLPSLARPQQLFRTARGKTKKKKHFGKTKKN